MALSRFSTFLESLRPSCMQVFDMVAAQGPYKASLSCSKESGPGPSTPSHSDAGCRPYMGSLRCTLSFACHHPFKLTVLHLTLRLTIHRAPGTQKKLRAQQECLLGSPGPYTIRCLGRGLLCIIVHLLMSIILDISMTSQVSSQPKHIVTEQPGHRAGPPHLANAVLRLLLRPGT